MTPSLDAGVPAWGRLPHLGLLRFAGPDAVGFLQGQVSNDTRSLSAGATVLAAYSSPQGRVLAVLHLLPHSSGVIALLPRELALPTLERLRKYVLRSKVLIEDLSDRFAVLGRFASPPAADGASPVAPASPPAADGASPAADAGAPAADGAAVPADAHHDQGTARGYVERDGIGFAPVGSGAGREWAIGELRELERHGLILEAEAAAAAEPASHMEHDWRLADIRAGLPQIYAVTRELFVAQMLNLDLIDGISFTKGCFTGQEIIARTQHLGRIKRRLHRLRLPAGTWAVGQAVQLSDGRSGRLTELARTGAGFEALAVLSLEPGGAAAGTAGAAAGADAAAVESATAERIAATELPLPYQLGS